MISVNKVLTGSRYSTSLHKAFFLASFFTLLDGVIGVITLGFVFSTLSTPYLERVEAGLGGVAVKAL